MLAMLVSACTDDDRNRTPVQAQVDAAPAIVAEPAALEVPPDSVHRSLGSEVTAPLAALQNIAADEAATTRLRETHMRWLRQRAQSCAGAAEEPQEPRTGAQEACYHAKDLARGLQLTRRYIATASVLKPSGIRQHMPRPGPQVQRRGTSLRILASGDRKFAAMLWQDRERRPVDGGVDLYDVEKKRLFSVVPLPESPKYGTFSANGALLYVTSGIGYPVAGWLYIIDTLTGTLLASIPEVNGEIHRVSDQRLLFSRNVDGYFGFDLRTLKILGFPSLKGECRSLGLAASPSGDVAVYDARCLELWHRTGNDDTGWYRQGRHWEVKETPERDNLAAVIYGEEGDTVYAATRAGHLLGFDANTLEQTMDFELTGVHVAGEHFQDLEAGWVGILIAHNERMKSLLWQPALMLGAISDIGESFFDSSERARTHSGAFITAGSIALTVPEHAAMRPMPVLETELIRQERLQHPGPGAPFTALTEEAQIEAVGVYSGDRSSQELTDIQVAVGRTDAPLVLVLASGDAIRWQVSTTDETRLIKILLSGNQRSEVSGAWLAERVYIGPAWTDSTSPFRGGEGGYSMLNKEVQLYTGRSIDQLQGAQEGNHFSIGTNPPRVHVQRPVASQPPPYRAAGPMEPPLLDAFARRHATEISTEPAPPTEDALPVQRHIYSRVGPDGTIEFSDKPLPLTSSRGASRSAEVAKKQSESRQ